MAVKKIIIEKTPMGRHIVRNAENGKQLFESELILSVNEVYKRVLDMMGVQFELHDNFYLNGKSFNNIHKL